MNTAQRQATFWIVGFVLFLLALWQIGSVLLPFAAGFAIAFYLDPWVNRLERIGVPRGSGTPRIAYAVELLMDVARAVRLVSYACRICARRSCWERSRRARTAVRISSRLSGFTR